MPPAQKMSSPESPSVAITKKRVAVIEIGSRAVRLLVADVSESSGLQPVVTDWRQTQLAAAIARGDTTSLSNKMTEVAAIVHEFKQKASSEGISNVAVFGTEALRQIREKRLIDLGAYAPGIEILNKKTEAKCSLLAAVKGCREPIGEGRQVLAIDQGGGSLELAVGSIQRNYVNLSDYRSYRLGAEALTELLRTVNGNTEKFHVAVAERIDGYRFAKIEKSARAFVLGSVATNSGWMFVRRDEHERYDPRRVHGFSISVGKAVQFVLALEKAMVSDPERIRHFIDPRNPSSEEFEILLTGLITLTIFLRKYGIDQYTVSGHGMRYGMAWLLASKDVTSDVTQ